MKRDFQGYRSAFKCDCIIHQAIKDYYWYRAGKFPPWARRFAGTNDTAEEEP